MKNIKDKTKVVSSNLGRVSISCLIASVVQVAAFILFALATPGIVHAADFAVSTVEGLISTINDANNEVTYPGPDTIILEPETYTLGALDNTTHGPNGLPSITSLIEIVGAGAGTTIIKRQDGVEDFRIFHVAQTGVLTLDGVTVRGGSAVGEQASSLGGGLFNCGTVTLTMTTITGNSAQHHGGGIYNSYGNMTLINTTISGNSSEVVAGGIWNQGNMTLTNTTITGNSASGCGGIWNATGKNMSLTDTTISGNSAESYAGGINNQGNMTLTNTTISGNSVQGLGSYGGGIYNSGGDMTLTNTTISGNSAQYKGGGIYNWRADGDIKLKNTIVANSQSGGDCEGDPITSLGHNLDSDGTCGLTGPGDLFNIDPMLGPLQDNGGPTQTHAFLPGSPAIDAGDNADCPATDQRGEPRPQDGDGDGQPICDIGAFELEEEVVTVPGDLDGDGQVCRTDLNIILSHRNQPASVCPDCDIDGDGMITALDARKLVLLCTRPRCACEEPPD